MDKDNKKLENLYSSILINPIKKVETKRNLKQNFVKNPPKNIANMVLENLVKRDQYLSKKEKTSPLLNLTKGKVVKPININKVLGGY